MDKSRMRREAVQARVARVGTLDVHGRVHIVPVTFVIEGDTWYSPSDTGSRLVRRLEHLKSDPRVTILIDTYDEDWAQVWWVRLRGHGRLAASQVEHDHAWQLLVKKYPQFAHTPPDEGAGPVMAVDITGWSGWSYTS